MHRLDPNVQILSIGIDVYQRPCKQQRRPHQFSDEEIQRLLQAALSFPSPRAPLRPLSLYTMLMLTPHTFRHSVGVQMVAAGIDATVIRDWLGHARLDTTNLYARANLETKRRVLEQIDPSTKPGKPPRWKQSPELLAWLDSL